MDRGRSARLRNPLLQRALLVKGLHRRDLALRPLGAAGKGLHATVLHLLGLDHKRLTFYHNGIHRRLTDVHGEVVRELLA